MRFLTKLNQEVSNKASPNSNVKVSKTHRRDILTNSRYLVPKQDTLVTSFTEGGFLISN